MIVRFTRYCSWSTIILALFSLALTATLGWFFLTSGGGRQLLDLSPAWRKWRPYLGWEKSVTYLVLFQNSAELRPTGGFWGSYAVVSLSRGKLLSFSTDDIYNLDKNVAGSSVMPLPPAPLKQYLKVQRWYLRDANWSPDFPTTAKLALDFYQREGGTEQFDGVIAITPEIVSRLLKLLGTIEIDGQLFTSEQAIEQLQYYVQLGYREDGVPRPSRKSILQPLAQEIVRRLIDKPPSVWLNVLTIIEESLERRDIQTYFTDQVLQQEIAKEPWGGAIRETAGDYLMVVDANLNALKSDPKVKREIEYTLERSAGETIATVKIRYRHTATQGDWRTSPYRTYMRVFVPDGSELILSDNKIIVESENGKTVFGFYHVVSLGETREIVLRYRLPSALLSQPYTLLVQRQAGTANYPLTVRLLKERKELRLWQSLLNQDQEFRL